ncbi:hypothetical protein MMC06_000678 [Schaereria dolodes]|nr:hypothetical protein [Schaereria dolodes]
MPSQDKRVAGFLCNLLYMTEKDDAAILVDVGLVKPNPGTEPPYPHVPDYTGYGGFNYQRESAAQQTGEFLNRLKMALFGGTALVIPMPIMRLHPTELTTLLTTSIFVLAVAIILSDYMRDAATREILEVITAHAAALVVFVGVGGN